MPAGIIATSSGLRACLEAGGHRGGLAYECCQTGAMLSIEDQAAKIGFEIRILLERFLQLEDARGVWAKAGCGQGPELAAVQSNFDATAVSARRAIRFFIEDPARPTGALVASRLVPGWSPHSQLATALRRDLLLLENRVLILDDVAISPPEPGFATILANLAMLAEDFKFDLASASAAAALQFDDNVAELKRRFGIGS